MTTFSGLFLSLALAAAAYSSFLLSINDGWREVFGGDRVPSKLVLRTLAVWVGLLSVLPWLSVATGILVGWMSWLFCILPVSGLPVVAIWPFKPKLAVFSPPACCAGLAFVVWLCANI